MSRPQVVVLDYGSGNLRSAQRALARVGADVTVSADPAAAAAAAGLVVPGVGAFAACMAGVDRLGGRAVIRDRMADGRPVLGICVGLQILFSRGEERGGGERQACTAGIGVFDGAVTLLDAPVLPHMGWNQVQPPPSSRLFRGVGAERFYFLHSYAARDVPPPALPTYAWHGQRFLAAVEAGPVAGTQFHPEKSGDAGAALLSNWLDGLA